MVISKATRASSNLAMLEFAVSKLGELTGDLVFLGGCTTALFITDSEAVDVRATFDVDCIVDVISLGQYHKIEKKLRALGFKQTMEGDLVCRWFFDDLVLDVMPTDEKVLGFGNRWYSAAIEKPVVHILKNGSIKTVAPPYFLATKLEAFLTRGENDLLTSHDYEDIISVIDGRPEIVNEIKNADSNLKVYLARIFSEITDRDQFISTLPGHLNYGPLTEKRMQVVLSRIQQIALG